MTTDNQTQQKKDELTAEPTTEYDSIDEVLDGFADAAQTLQQHEYAESLEGARKVLERVEELFEHFENLKHPGAGLRALCNLTEAAMDEIEQLPMRKEAHGLYNQLAGLRNGMEQLQADYDDVVTEKRESRFSAGFYSGPDRFQPDYYEGRTVLCLDETGSADVVSNETVEFGDVLEAPSSEELGWLNTVSNQMSDRLGASTIFERENGDEIDLKYRLLERRFLELDS